ncbi:MAG: ATP-binding protein [Chitinophagaceae bacterium]|nr:ATP-binding protein [Chitinophagaceae bacterium]
MVELVTLRDMEFASLPENINLIEVLVEELKSELDLSEEAEANILVSLSEAVNNAIFHGNNSDPAKKVRVCVEKLDKEIVFSIEDQGFGFNLSEVKDPTAIENLDRPTGRGIFLMRNLSDRMEYAEGGRKVVITFFRN